MLQEYRKIWGRKQSRPLKDRHKRLLNDLLPLLEIKLSPSLQLHPSDLFANKKKEIHLEIGFGGGEHLATRALANPDIGFIGCEPFINGVVSLLGHIQEKDLSNIQVVVDDARLLLDSLPAGSLHRIYILFPDPWPKKRHHKRRIVSPDTIQALSRVLQVEGTLYMATDIDEYAVWMQETLKEREEFSIDMDQRACLTQRPLDWPPPTRYEQKGNKAGRAAHYMIYRKKK